MKINTKKIKGKFGWKEVLLCAVLALVAIIFVIVFTGNTATVKFVSMGGNFDAGEGASIYDYDFYKDGETDADMDKYHEELTKEYRISSVATLPEAKRAGYEFDGWFYAEIGADGALVYGEEFTEDSVKKLEKDSETSVYAKWSLQDETKTVSRKDAIIAALNISWKGMLGIFIVVTIIFVCIVGLNLLTKKLAARKQAAQAKIEEKTEESAEKSAEENAEKKDDGDNK